MIRPIPSQYADFFDHPHDHEPNNMVLPDNMVSWNPMALALPLDFNIKHLNVFTVDLLFGHLFVCQKY